MKWNSAGITSFGADHITVRTEDWRYSKHPDGEELTPADRGLDLLLVDCAWRKLAAISKAIDGELLARRLPKLVTAYPRRSKVALDPRDGLASVEALYAAISLLEGPRPELLANYRWAEQFLASNPSLER